MPFVPVPNVAMVEMKFSCNLEFAENTFYYEKATPWDETQLQTLAVALGVSYHTNWITLQHNACVLQEVYARDLTTDAAAQYSDLTYAGTVGLQSDPEPNNVSMAVERYSGLTGRSTRGRIFWLGLYSLAVTGNQFLAGIAGDVVSALTDFDAAAVGALTCTPVIVSRRHAGVPLSVGVTYPIQGWRVTDNNVDSQRRRLAGRGI